MSRLFTLKQVPLTSLEMANEKSRYVLVSHLGG